LQIKKRHFLSPGEDFFSRPKVVPYPISSCLENHQVFLGSLISSQHSGSGDILSEDEEQALVDEEIVEESPTDLMTLDLVETYHRVNSLCAMITEKYSFSDEEDFHEMHHVEDPLEAALTFVLATHEDKEMVNFSHIDEPSSIYGSPLQQWIDQACGFSFQQDFLPPTHLHEFHFMINYMSIYAHDHYVLDLSLLYYMIKHRGRYLDEMLSRWLHWLYDFT
jgi:hypothetical protein